MLRRCRAFPRMRSLSCSSENLYGKQVKFSISTPQLFAEFNPRRALVLSKITRYEYERRRHPDLCEGQLEDLLKQRGSDYSMLLYHHYVHKGCEKTLVQALAECGLDTKLVSRLEYNRHSVCDADVVFTVGGDGTFLLGAAKIADPHKPIIGINSDPTRSAGHLLLPTHHSVNLRPAIRKLLQGEFSWLLRSRVRVVLHGKDVHREPVELHSQQLARPECRYLDLDFQDDSSNDEDDLDSYSARYMNSYVLPVLALNEVFIGECVSARVSYYEMSVDGAAPFKQKSSGLCVCTGTGSTSWAYNINKLNRQNVQELIEDVAIETGASLDVNNESLIDRVLHRVNQRLVFAPDAAHMCYTIRDPIESARGDWSCQRWCRRARASARQLMVRSRCFDASLVIDGGLSFAFNDGTQAELQVRPEYALRTVQML